MQKSTETKYDPRAEPISMTLSGVLHNLIGSWLKLVQKQLEQTKK